MVCLTCWNPAKDASSYQLQTKNYDYKMRLIIFKKMNVIVIANATNSIYPL